MEAPDRGVACGVVALIVIVIHGIMVAVIAIIYCHQRVCHHFHDVSVIVTVPLVVVSHVA